MTPEQQQWIRREYGHRYDFSKIELAETNFHYRSSQIFYPLAGLVVVSLIYILAAGMSGFWGSV